MPAKTVGFHDSGHLPWLYALCDYRAFWQRQAAPVVGWDMIIGPHFSQSSPMIKKTFWAFCAAFLVFAAFLKPVSADSVLAPRSPDEEAVIQAYKKTNKAVVNVSTRAQTMDMFGVSAQEGTGSGVIVDAEKALVITNYHVIGDAVASKGQIAVTLANGQSYPVRLIGLDPDNELAVLQIVDPPQDLIAIEFGDSSKLEVGQRVIAIGNPFGLNRTMTEGVISSLERTIRAESGRVIEDVIQTDAPINPGNSGGPLLDKLGRLVGLNTAILSRTGENAGIGFSIPINTVKKVLPSLIKYGKVLRPKIGVVIADTDYGPVLLYVQPDGPADRAGLSGARQEFKQGGYTGYRIDVSQADFVMEVNGKSVTSKAEVLDALSKAESSDAIELVVRRGAARGKVRTVKVKPVLG